MIWRPQNEEYKVNFHCKKMVALELFGGKFVALVAGLELIYLSICGTIQVSLKRLRTY